MRDIPATVVVRLVLMRELQAERRCMQELYSAGYTIPSPVSNVQMDRPCVPESSNAERALIRGEVISTGWFYARDRVCAICQLLRLSVEDTDLVLHNIFGGPHE